MANYNNDWYASKSSVSNYTAQFYKFISKLSGIAGIHSAIVTVIHTRYAPTSFLCLLFYPLCFCYPSYLSEAPFPSPLTHSEILTVMLKLAASISASALAPRASKQEAEDASKTSLSNVHAHLCTESQRHKYSLYILIHSFLLTCTTERVNKCAKVPAHLSAHMHAHTHAYAHKDTHTHTDTDR